MYNKNKYIPTIKILIEKVGISGTFFILGALYFVVMFASALYLEKPEEGYLPEKFLNKINKFRFKYDKGYK